MGLSVSEKRELRSIEVARLTTRISALKAQNQPLLTALAAQARNAALEQLGIADAMAQLDALYARQAALEREIDGVEALVYARIQHVEHIRYHTRPERIQQIIRTVQKPLEDALLAETPLGAQIAALQAEQGRLEETIWAATSPRQVSDIFQALNTLLDDQPTALEQAAYAIQHPED